MIVSQARGPTAGARSPDSAGTITLAAWQNASKCELPTGSWALAVSLAPQPICTEVAVTSGPSFFYLYNFDGDDEQTVTGNFFCTDDTCAQCEISVSFGQVSSGCQRSSLTPTTWWRMYAGKEINRKRERNKNRWGGCFFFR
jgi:hypothetical protein